MSKYTNHKNLSNILFRKIYPGKGKLPYPSQIEGPREKITATLEISPFTIKVTPENVLLGMQKKCSLPHQFSINKNK